MVKYSECVNNGNVLCEKAGQLLAERFIATGKAAVLKESFGIFKEAGQTTANNTGAYTTLLASTLYTAAIDKIQPVLDLVDINEDLKNGQGYGAMKLPRRVPTVAVEVSEGAVVSYFPEGTDDITVTCKQVVAGTSLTWQILKRGMTGFATYVMKDAADAISRKLASDILNGLAAGSTLAAETGGITYAKVLDAEAKINDASHSNGVKFGFLADRIVLTPTANAIARKDTDFKTAMAYASAVPGTPITVARQPEAVGNLMLVQSPFLTACQALVLQAKKNILVKESDVETFEGRIPGSIDNEIIAMMSYSLAILWPQSVCKITA